jgi:large subunit ribosomal protein L22
MEAKAIARFVRISPQKARLVVDLVRGMKVEEADRILAFSRKRAAGLVKKVLKSALANATQNPNIDEKILYVKEIFINQGPTMKRHRAKTMGRTAPVKRRMSHITVVLDEQ